MLAAAVSGSFHRHMDAISSAVRELMDLSVRVLSPADPRVVAAQGEFLFVASDRVRSVRLVQDRHLDCIRAANFLWLVCPDGYVGQSASMEIGFAAGAGVPIFASRVPADLTLREYVTVVPGISAAIIAASASTARRCPPGILIDPGAAIQQAHAALERVGAILNDPKPATSAAHHLFVDLTRLHENLTLPTSVH